MRYVTLVLSLVLVVGLVACGDDDAGNNNNNVGPTACEVMETLEASALESVCVADATCVFCDCASQGMVMDVTGDGTDLAFECVADTTTCDATEADMCVADEASCLSDLTSSAETLCASSIPSL